jgi:hypothetical protein
MMTMPVSSGRANYLFSGGENRLEKRRRPEPQARTEKLLRMGDYLRKEFEGLREDFRKRSEGLDNGSRRYGKLVSPVGRREVLQLRSTYRGAVTRGMTNIQAIRRNGRSQERVVKQEKGEAERNPGVPSRHCPALGRMSGRMHLDSLRTIVGLCGGVKGMPGEC